MIQYPALVALCFRIFFLRPFLGPSKETIQKIVQSYCKDPDVPFSRYSIRMIERSEIYRKKIHFADARCGFVFCIDRIIIASIWFDVLPNGVLYIKQIQGKRGMGDILARFHWQRMLIRLAIEWGRQFHFSQIRLIAAKCNPWYSLGDSERRKRFHIYYDVSARREGFATEKGLPFHVLTFEHVREKFE